MTDALIIAAAVMALYLLWLVWLAGVASGEARGRKRGDADAALIVAKLEAIIELQRVINRTAAPTSRRAAPMLSGTPSRIQRLDAMNGNVINDDLVGCTTFGPRTTADRGADDRPAAAEPEMTLSVPPPQLRDDQPSAEYVPPPDDRPLRLGEPSDDGKWYFNSEDPDFDAKMCIRGVAAGLRWPDGAGLIIEREGAKVRVRQRLHESEGCKGVQTERYEHETTLHAALRLGEYITSHGLASRREGEEFTFVP